MDPQGAASCLVIEIKTVAVPFPRSSVKKKLFLRRVKEPMVANAVSIVMLDGSGIAEKASNELLPP